MYESTSNDVTSNYLVLYIYCIVKVTHYNPADIVSNSNEWQLYTVMGFLWITVLWATAPVAAAAVETAPRVLSLLLPWLLLLLLLPWKLRRGCCFLGFSCCCCSRGNCGAAAASTHCCYFRGFSPFCCCSRRSCSISAASVAATPGAAAPVGATFSVASIWLLLPCWLQWQLLFWLLLLRLLLLRMLHMASAAVAAPPMSAIPMAAAPPLFSAPVASALIAATFVASFPVAAAPTVTVTM